MNFRISLSISTKGYDRLHLIFRVSFNSADLFSHCGSYLPVSLHSKFLTSRYSKLYLVGWYIFLCAFKYSRALFWDAIYSA